MKTLKREENGASIYKMKNILIIEDDTEINNLMAEAFKKAGYSCTQAFSGTEALLRLDADTYHLAVMDLMLPGLAGEELLPKLKQNQNLPVIVVSAKDSLDSKVNLLAQGAEDYMTKPFEIRELIARADVQIRRFSAEGAAGAGLSYKDLTKQEFKILELLLSNPHKVYAKQEIYDYAWDDFYIGEDKTINVHISNIRKKLKTASDEEYIETVWGIGFRIAK